MKTLAIDIETFSSADLKKCGAYAYAADPRFEILLFGYAFDDDPVRVIDLASGETLPQEVLVALDNEAVLKTAYNAQFERICLSHYLYRLTADMFGDYRPMKSYLPPKAWRCTMVHGLYLGLPGNLAQLSQVLIRDTDRQKMSEGKNLIPYFCSPVKPTKANGGRTRNRPTDDPEKWALFKKYNARDVEVERDIRIKLAKYPLPESEQSLYTLDQEINDRGIRIDLDLVKNALDIDRQHKEKSLAAAIALTGLDNPASVAQLKDWLFDTECLVIDSLNKETVKELLKDTDSETTRKALQLRQELAKTSVKKYAAMENALCPDGRVHGLLQFYGANRTGRWAGRLVQVQNLPQNHLPDLEDARGLVKNGDLQLIELLYGSPQDVLSQLIRTAFIPAEGHRFAVTDFSAIEARVIAWLAKEEWRMEVFRTHGKIYEASAAAMFHVPIETIDKKNPLRQKGKVAELALGYQGSVGALIKMGALKMGLAEEELPDIVTRWRKASPNIAKLWGEVEEAAKTAVQDHTQIRVGPVSYIAESGFLFAELPSGRRLAYVRPRLQPGGRFDKISLTYEGLNQETKKWGRVPTYGGKLVENLVQSIARDCLAIAMLRLAKAQYKINMHVHDEVIMEIDAEDPAEFKYLDHINSILARPISWAPGLPLKGDGFTSLFYKKDD